MAATLRLTETGRAHLYRLAEATPLRPKLGVCASELVMTEIVTALDPYRR